MGAQAAVVNLMSESSAKTLAGFPEQPGRRSWAVLLFFAAVALLCYSSALPGPFVQADLPMVASNPNLKAFTPSLHSVIQLVKANSTHPFSELSLALSYYVHGPNPFWFRFTNVVIHIFAAFFLFLLLKTTLQLPGAGLDAHKAALIAFFAALIFLVQPVQTQAVSYIVKRKCILPALTALLCMLFYVKARLASSGGKRIALWAAAGVLFVFTIGSRENMAALPFLIVLYDCFFIQDMSRKSLIRSLALMAGMALLGVFSALAVMDFAPMNWLTERFVVMDFTPAQRLFTQPRAVLTLLSLFMFPHPSRLNADHDIPLSNSLLAPPWTLLFMAVIASCIIWAVLNAKKRRIAAFCILWILGTLAIESSVLPLHLMTEHRLYLPSLFACLLVSFLSFTYLSNKRAVAMLCCLAAVFSFWTWQRNHVWADAKALRKDCAVKSPNLLRPMRHWAETLFYSQRYAEAVPALGKTLALYKDFHARRIARAKSSEQKGDIYHAMRHYEMARFAEKLYAEDGANLIAAMKAMGMEEQARHKTKEIARASREMAAKYKNLGGLLIAQGMAHQARAICEEILQYDPNDSEAIVTLGEASFSEKDWTRAEKYFQRALSSKQQTARANLGLGMVYLEQGDKIRSAKRLGRALKSFQQENAKDAAPVWRLYFIMKQDSGKVGLLLSRSQARPAPAEGFELGECIGSFSGGREQLAAFLTPYENKFVWDGFR